MSNAKPAFVGLTTHLHSPYICIGLISNEILLYLVPSSLHFQRCCVYISSAYCLYFSDHQTVQLIKDKRSNSCFSESSEPGSLKNGAEQGRRPSRAFLIKQRDSGEETLVTLTPVGGRQNVPTIVGPQFSKGKDIQEFIKFDANFLLNCGDYPIGNFLER